MQNQDILKNETAQSNRFIKLISAASRCEIREISSESQHRVLGVMDSFLKSLSGKTDGLKRAFLVEVDVQALDNSVSVPEDRDYLLRNALALLNAKEFLLARNIFSLLLKQNDHDSDAIRGLGICLLYLGENSSAKKCFHAMWDEKGSEEALVWLGKSYVISNEDTLALKYFSRIEEPSYLSAEVQFEYFKDYGNCLTRQGKLEEAVKYYQKALEVEPNSATIHVNLGTLEIQRDRKKEARRHFDIALTAESNNAKAICGLGILEQLKGNQAAAIKLFRKANDLEPQNIVSLFQLLEISIQNQDFEDIKFRLLKFASEFPGNPEIYYALSTIGLRESNWAECKTFVDKTLSIDPKHQKALKLKSDISSFTE